MTGRKSLQCLMDNLNENLPEDEHLSVPDSWGDQACDLFSNVYRAIKNNGPTFILHPHDYEMPKVQFETIAWNAAWIAASEFGGWE